MTTVRETTLTILNPGDPGWEDARQAWNLAVDQHPAAIALPSSAGDAAAAVRFARERGLRVAAQGTGHGATPMGSLADTLLIKTSRMHGLTIDPVARVARAEAGVIWRQVAEEAAVYGLTGLAGSSPDVGVVGYTLGGGMSWLGRTYGCRRTTSRRSRSSPPTAASSAPTPAASRTCSGRCAAAAAASASSRRSSCGCSLSPGCTPGCSGGRLLRL